MPCVRTTLHLFGRADDNGLRPRYEYICLCGRTSAYSADPLIYGRHIYHRPMHYPNRNGIHFFLLNTHRDMCVRATTPVFRLCLVTQIRTTAVHAVRHLSFLVPRQNHSMNDITSVQPNNIMLYVSTHPYTTTRRQLQQCVN